MNSITMERRVQLKSHARCGVREKVAITSKPYLSLLLNAGKERICIDNVWFEELVLMQFEKGTVHETTIPFGFTPEDRSYLEIVEL